MVKIKKNSDLGNCSICHLAVRHVDDYVKVEDYIKGRIKSTSFFHRTCFRNKINSIYEANGLQDVVRDLAKRTNETLKRMGI